MTWRAEAGAATHVGMVRDGNEDAMLVEAPLYVVADGMGGHQGGEVASALAIRTLAATLRTRRSGASGLIASIEEANAAVYERQQLDRALAGMGTTITAAFLDDDGLHLGQVGDSRAYLLRGGALRQLTDDHSLVSEMVRSGEITAEQARTHPQRSMLTRALGIDKSVRVDAFDVELEDGDRVLLCSDGMTAIASDDEIADLLRAGDDPTTTAEELVALANRVGGPDNTTVVVLDISEDPTTATAGGGSS